MKLNNRPAKMGDLRITVANPAKAAQVDGPDQAEAAALPSSPIGPSANNPFRPGDTVIYRFNMEGTVISVEKDGVQVDFGLGSHYLSYQVLKLSQN
ncbi:MAG: hypothetical protein IH586_18940 [Anaerolineaceae bacterium]|nr:hypothetical protein [Anaerolineaceae bacterium]